MARLRDILQSFSRVQSERQTAAVHHDTDFGSDGAVSVSGAMEEKEE